LEVWLFYLCAGCFLFDGFSDVSVLITGVMTYTFSFDIGELKALALIDAHGITPDNL
jgi:hypothetical protein